jgi:hypothetical protein
MVIYCAFLEKKINKSHTNPNSFFFVLVRKKTFNPKNPKKKEIGIPNLFDLQKK